MSNPTANNEEGKKTKPIFLGGLLYIHRIHGAAIYGNIYHQYTPNVSIYIYTSTMDPMGMSLCHYIMIPATNARQMACPCLHMSPTAGCRPAALPRQVLPGACC